MGMRIVTGVNRSSRHDDIPDQQLVFFEGEMLADQYIDALYRNEWKLMQDIGSTEGNTFDRWSNDDRYSDAPLFYKTQHELWNQVPPNVFRVAGHFDAPGVIHPLIPKTVFHDTMGADTELTVERFDPRFERERA